MFVAGTSVYALSSECQDQDSAAGKQIQTYAIASGDDGTAKFTIDNSGVIETSANALDYETKSLYNLIIHAADTAQTATTTVIVRVNILLYCFLQI